MADFTIKRNDLLPAIRAYLKNADGTALDLTGRSVKFIMRLRSAADLSAAKVNTTASITDATAGLVSYQWVGTDTDTAGAYIGEFETLLGAQKQTVPSGGYVTVDVVADLG